MSPITWTAVLLAGVTCVFGLGQETAINNYPSLVQIEDRVGTLWLQQCAGSVLTSFHALTSAACVDTDNLAIRRVRAGSSNRGSGGTVVGVASIIRHESYGTLDNVGDIAIVRFSLSLPLGDTIAQAQILGQGVDLPTNLPVTLVSWGTTTGGENNLYALDLYLVDNDSCMESYLTADTPRDVTDTMLCSGLTSTSGRDLDNRDWGAPLFYAGVTVGVVSFGVSRGNDALPVVSTAVSSYTSWIVENAV